MNDYMIAWADIGETAFQLECRAKDMADYHNEWPQLVATERDALVVVRDMLDCLIQRIDQWQQPIARTVTTLSPKAENTTPPDGCA